MRGVIFFFLMLAAAISLPGCNTLKGTAGVVNGLSKDIGIAWNSISKADAWLQQKAW